MREARFPLCTSTSQVQTFVVPRESQIGVVRSPRRWLVSHLPWLTYLRADKPTLSAPWQPTALKRVTDRHFYVRQLKDMKIKAMVEVFTPSVMLQYAELCGWSLAHAHARSGEPAKIAGYLGKSDQFDKAIAEFSVAYADQSEKDHECLLQAVRAGKLEVFIEEV
jgi:hypothetical protein